MLISISSQIYQVTILRKLKTKVYISLFTRDEEGKKLSLLDHDAQVINQEIDVINELVNFVKEMDGNNPDILLFHQNYKLFREKADKSFAFELKSKNCK